MERKWNFLMQKRYFLKSLKKLLRVWSQERERERERMRPSHYNTSATTYCSESLEEYHQKIANINRYLFE